MLDRSYCHKCAGHQQKGGDADITGWAGQKQQAATPARFQTGKLEWQQSNTDYLTDITGEFAIELC